MNTGTLIERVGIAEWHTFVVKFQAEHARWPTSSEVEAGLRLPVSPHRVTGN